jgi:Ras family protein T1
LLHNAFITNPPHVLPEITLPQQWTRENATTKIVDSSAKVENQQQLRKEIKKADVICVVYQINREDSFERLATYWLPLLRKEGRNCPVVLVGNKIDLKKSETDSLEENIMPIMDEFKEVETCVECSAKIPLNISEVFYFAIKAVLHPTAPIYDSRTHVLKTPCIDALRRIFRLCDSDKNGFLDDVEIDAFQKKCFGSPLQKHELENVKNVVKESEPDGVTSKGLTELGFLFLHTLFIQRGRLETTWTVLRTFGYGDDLSLRESYLYPKFEVSPKSSVELSSDGYKFLTELFQSYDKDKDGFLKPLDLLDLFSTSPGSPWDYNNEGITLQSFLAMWSMTTLLDYKVMLAYLAYLGYHDTDRTNALKVTKPRGDYERRNGNIERDVFLAYVFGATGSGKVI